MLQALIAWRFLTGSEFRNLVPPSSATIPRLFPSIVQPRLTHALTVGIGAEYPAGSVACSESTENPGVKGRIQHMLFVLATNCMIDVGFVVARCAASLCLPCLNPSERDLTRLAFRLFCSFVPLVLLWICGENHLRLVWRLTFGLGIVPAALVLLWRLRMPSEPVRYRESAIKRNVPYGLVFRRYWKPFVGISLCWFLYEWVPFPSSPRDSSATLRHQASFHPLWLTSGCFTASSPIPS